MSKYLKDEAISEFIAITSAPIDTATKYLARFDSFEGAVESYLEDPCPSPTRPPDEPFSDVLITSPEKKSLIHCTIDTTRSFKEQPIKVRQLYNDKILNLKYLLLRAMWDRQEFFFSHLLSDKDRDFNRYNIQILY